MNGSCGRKSWGRGLKEKGVTDGGEKDKSDEKMERTGWREGGEVNETTAE